MYPVCWWRVQLPWIWHEQGHDQLNSEKNRVQEVTYGTLTEENLSKRHQLYAGQWLLHSGFIVTGRKPPHWGWGQMHKAYLELYHPVQYNDLILSGKLWTYLADLNEQAQNRLDCIIAQMKKAEEIKEELKARDQMAWVRAISIIRNWAEEVIRSEMIYCWNVSFPV